MPSVSLAAAEPPLILALDLGTSSIRAMLFDRQARAIADGEEQRRYRLRHTADGGAETDAPVLFDLLVRCVDGVLGRAGSRAAEIAAVGTSSFWHGLLGVDGGGEPTTPLLYWGDTRSAVQAAALRRELDAAAIQTRTGCRFHSSYWPAKLRWLADVHPDLVARTARWVSFADYAARRLHGDAAAATSVSMASGTGLLDVGRIDWDDVLLAALDLDRDRLSPLTDSTATSTLTPACAGRWPALARVPWYPALGDGAAANVGSGAVGPGRIALTLGTSGAMRLILPAPPGDAIAVPADLWVYRLDGDHAVVGGALSNGGNVLRWTRDLLGVPVDGEAMAEAADLPPDDHGLTVLPFVAGERAPGWHDHAAGVVAGLILTTKPAHLLRATMEAVAYRFGRVYDTLQSLASANHVVIANGGAILHSPVLLGIVADVLGHDLTALAPDDEASARGAALVALVGSGILPELGAAPDPAAGATIHRADPERHARYAAGRQRHDQLEALLFTTLGQATRA